MMTYKNIYLNKGKEDSLLRFHPWIFSGAINQQSLDDGLNDGDTVRVFTHDKRFIAVGHFQYGSIAVRVLSFEDEPIDITFWKKRLTSAYNMRKAIGVVVREDGERHQNTTFRLVHGEGDNMPGLIIDSYGKTAVMQAHSLGMHECRRDIAQALKEVMGGEIDNVYYKSDTTLPFKSEIEKDNGFLIGNSDENITIENGLKFHVDWLRGQKTGFFIDQRENRQLIEKFSKGRSVLNMFCYTGGFSVYARSLLVFRRATAHI